MILHTLELSLPVTSGVTTIQSVVVNNTTYIPDTPLVVSAANAAAIKAWFDSLSLGTWSVDFYAGSGSGDEDILEIYSECSALITSTTGSISLTENSNIFIIAFQGFECSYGDCEPLVIKTQNDIDCEDLSCINFTDVTGVFNATTNIGGYGGDNTPSYAEITGTTFGLYDSDNVLIAEQDAGYVPTALFNSVCVEISGFGIAELTPGNLYYLNYIVNYNSSGSGEAADCIKIPFIAPCCGGTIANNLTVGFSINQQLGCTSLVFEDTTGAYNATTNPGGWGTPNYNYSDIVYTKITVVLDDGTVKIFTDFLPTEAVPTYTINGIDLGYSGTIDDQVINVTYQVFVAGGCEIGENSSPILLYCNSARCLASQRDSVLDECGGCNGSPQLDKVIALTFELDNIINAFSRNAGCTQGLIQKFYKACSKGCLPC